MEQLAYTFQSLRGTKKQALSLCFERCKLRDGVEGVLSKGEYSCSRLRNSVMSSSTDLGSNLILLRDEEGPKRNWFVFGMISSSSGIAASRSPCVMRCL